MSLAAYANHQFASYDSPKQDDSYELCGRQLPWKCECVVRDFTWSQMQKMCHIKSSDASNLERLNRWNAALALFSERPVVGWGPGTYQFVYAPFQRSKDRTIISTNNADGGNAHSEYLGPLAEQGVLGLIGVLGLLGFCLHWGFRLQRILTDREDRILAMGVFLGLMTYFVHGVLNNYLDTDKARALFWGFFAVMLALDLQASSAKASKETRSTST